MVRQETHITSITNIIYNISEAIGSEKIEISSDFQRGDDETGVWKTSNQREYINSLHKKYPTGIITLVKDHQSAMAYNHNWKVLDGGNRCRSIRDYINDLLTNSDGKRFNEESEIIKAQFMAFGLPVQYLTLERNDPSDTIANMFNKLNTSAEPLKNGELYKSHGWKKNIWQIEMAKKFIGGPIWSVSTYTDEVSDNRLHIIRTRWCSIFNTELGETKRCDSLAMIIGYILSATSKKIWHFDKRYERNFKLLGDVTPKNEENINRIYNKLTTFLDIMEEIYPLEFPLATFGKLTKGIPSQTKICMIWYTICIETIDINFKQKLIDFYKRMSTDTEIEKRYVYEFGIAGETTPCKITTLINFINKTMDG